MSLKYDFGRQAVRTEHNPFTHLPVAEVVERHTFRSKYAEEAQVLPNVVAISAQSNCVAYCPRDLVVKQLPSENAYDHMDCTPLGRYIRFRRNNATRKQYIEGSLVEGETELECVEELLQ